MNIEIGVAMETREYVDVMPLVFEVSETLKPPLPGKNWNLKLPFTDAPRFKISEPPA